MKRLFIIFLSFVMVASFCFSYIPQIKASGKKSYIHQISRSKKINYKKKFSNKPLTGIRIADVYTNLSSGVPNINTIKSIATNGSTWLIGGMNGSSTLYSYSGTTFIDLTSQIPGLNSSVLSIGWNGSTWMIGGHGISTLYSYNGTTFTDLTSQMPGLEYVWSIAWNGSTWLIGGMGTSSTLYSYNGTTFTDLTSQIPDMSCVLSIGWNGSTWLIGGTNGTSTLYSYNGTTFTDLSSGVPNMDAIWTITPNGSTWLIGGTNGTSTLYSYNGTTFTDLSSGVPNMDAIFCITIKESTCLIGGTGTSTLYSYNGTTFTDLSSNIPAMTGGGVISIASNDSTWLIGGGGVSGEETLPALYSLTFLTIQSINPSQAVNTGPINVTIKGTGFDNISLGGTVKLVKKGQKDIIATNVTVVSPTQITCTLPITGAASGQWDLVVTSSDRTVSTLIGGFTIISAPAPIPLPQSNELPYTGL